MLIYERLSLKMYGRTFKVRQVVLNKNIRRIQYNELFLFSAKPETSGDVKHDHEGNLTTMWRQTTT